MGAYGGGEVTLLADENVHRLIVAHLLRDGHEVVHVADLAPSISDEEVLALAVEREALLITNDRDFGELVFVGASRHAGVLLLRLAELPPPFEVVRGEIVEEQEVFHLRNLAWVSDYIEPVGSGRMSSQP